MSDGYDLARFVDAQDSGATYERALAELRAGRKSSHWMWFVFPQIAGLGRSGRSERYAIGSLAEAQAYVSHPVLGPRLVECANAVVQHGDRSAEQIFGGIDAVKLLEKSIVARQDDQASLFLAVEWIFNAHRGGAVVHDRAEDVRRAHEYADQYLKAGGLNAPLVKQWLSYLDKEPQ